MKIYFLILSLLLSMGASAAESPSQPAAKKEDKALEKTPKSLFLVKRAKLKADVAGPQFDAPDAQLRTVINDANMHNFKKFE